METKKENKKGFWASLFSPKPCSCSCGNNLIIEEEEKPAASCCCEDNAATTKTGIKEVKILGPGCAKCKSSYNVMGTPAVVVDEVVKIKGHVPSESEIKQIFGI